MRLNNIKDVEKWVFGFGTHATVVRPNTLAERLSKTWEESLKKYSGDAVRRDAV
jgi:predicted DNA-binding transcriptional regulator YafY